MIGDNQIFDENLKKEVPILDIIQQVFNDVNQHYSWIVAGNQKGYDDKQLDSAKVCMDKVFYVVFAKPPNKDTYEENENKYKKSYIDPSWAGAKRQGSGSCNTNLPQANPTKHNHLQKDALKREDDTIIRSRDLDGFEVPPMSIGREVH